MVCNHSFSLTVPDDSSPLRCIPIFCRVSPWILNSSYSEHEPESPVVLEFNGPLLSMVTHAHDTCPTVYQSCCFLMTLDGGLAVPARYALSTCCRVYFTSGSLTVPPPSPPHPTPPLGISRRWQQLGISSLFLPYFPLSAGYSIAVA